MGRNMCSHCGKIGHNSRACSTQNDQIRLRLFGVQLDISSNSLAMKKSSSVDCLSSPSTPSSSSTTPNSHVVQGESLDKLSHGYLSDCILEPSQERKKGVPPTVEEHRIFLLGLEKLGRGDWRGISRNFVTRTPAQSSQSCTVVFS